MATTQKTKDKFLMLFRIIVPTLLATLIGIGGWSLKRLMDVDRNVALVVQKVDGFEGDFEKLRNDVSTALTVLSQHGDEFQTMDGELLRLRTLYDELQVKIDAQTSDRFTGRDAAAMKQWVRDEFAAREKISELQHQKITMMIERLADSDP